MPNINLQPSDGKQLSKVPKLTNRGRLFIEYMADGLKTYEAYLKAGYRGNAHASYELKRLLAPHLKSLLESRGFSMEGVASELLSLAAHPVVDKEGKPLSNVTLGQKLSILKLFLQALPKPDAGRNTTIRNVTAFVVNRGTGSIDTTAENNP